MLFVVHFSEKYAIYFQKSLCKETGKELVLLRCGSKWYFRRHIQWSQRRPRLLPISWMLSTGSGQARTSYRLQGISRACYKESTNQLCSTRPHKLSEYPTSPGWRYQSPISNNIGVKTGTNKLPVKTMLKGRQRSYMNPVSVICQALDNNYQQGQQICSCKPKLRQTLVIAVLPVNLQRIKKKHSIHSLNVIINYQHLKLIVCFTTFII